MGCCDSKERKKNILVKKQDLSYNEESTELDQDDLNAAMLRKHLQRNEVERLARKISNPPSLQQFNEQINNDLRNNGNKHNKNNQEENDIQKRNKMKSQIEIDDEQNKSGYTVFYTPQNELSEIDRSFQDDSFLLDFQLKNQQKQYYEYDPQNRKTEIRQNFEDQSEQLMRRGSVPIFLKTSKAFIIPNNANKFDIQLFLEETKQALETLQQNQDLQQNQSLNTSQSQEIDDAGFESPKNLFDSGFDHDLKSFDNLGSSSKKIKKSDRFYESNNISNQIIHTNQIFQVSQ